MSLASTVALWPSVVLLVVTLAVSTHLILYVLASTVALWPSVVLLVVTLAVSTHLIPYVPGFHCGPVAQCCLHSPYTLCPGFHCGAVAQCCLHSPYTLCPWLPLWRCGPVLSYWLLHWLSPLTLYSMSLASTVALWPSVVLLVVTLAVSTHLKTLCPWLPLWRCGPVLSYWSSHWLSPLTLYSMSWLPLWRCGPVLSYWSLHWLSPLTLYPMSLASTVWPSVVSTHLILYVLASTVALWPSVVLLVVTLAVSTHLILYVLASTVALWPSVVSTHLIPYVPGFHCGPVAQCCLHSPYTLCPWFPLWPCGKVLSPLTLYSMSLASTVALWPSVVLLVVTLAVSTHLIPYVPGFHCGPVLSPLTLYSMSLCFHCGPVAKCCLHSPYTLCPWLPLWRCGPVLSYWLLHWLSPLTLYPMSLASTVALWPSVVSTHLILYVPGFHCGAVAQCCLTGRHTGCLHSPYTLCPWLPLWRCGPVLSPLTLYSMSLASTVALWPSVVSTHLILYVPGFHCGPVAQCCLTGRHTGCLHSPYTLCPGFHCGAVAQCCLTGRYTGCLHSPYTLCPWLPLWRCGPVLSPLTLYSMSLASTVALWSSVVSTHLIPYVPGFHCGAVAQCCLHSPYTLCPWLPLWPCGPVLSPLTLYSMPLASTVAQCCLTGCYTGCLHSPYTLCPGIHCSAVAQCCLTGRYTGCLHSCYTLCPWLPLWPSVVLLVVTLAVSTHLIPYVPGFHCDAVAQCCLTGRYTGCLHSPYTLCPWLSPLTLYSISTVAQCCLIGCYTGSLHSPYTLCPWLSPLTLYSISTVTLWPSVVLLVVTLAVSTHLILFVPGFHCDAVAQCCFASRHTGCLHSPYTLCPWLPL